MIHSKRKSDLLEDCRGGRPSPLQPWTTIAQTGAVNMYLSTGAGVLGRRGAFKNTLRNTGMKG